MVKSLSALGALAASAGAALASTVSVGPLDTSTAWFLDGSSMPLSGATERSPVGTTYGAFTGLATSTGGLVLLESSTAPVRDDIVNFDGVSEPINDYLAVAGGITRTVNEAWTVLGANSGRAVITIDGSGELFPSGLSSGNPPTALTRGAVGIGLTLPASLGGADPLTWNPSPNQVTAATVELFNAAGTSLTGGPLNVLALITNPNDWNGVIGIAFGSPSVGLGVTRVQFSFDVTKIPSPGAAALVGVAGLVAGARRRRG